MFEIKILLRRPNFKIREFIFSEKKLIFGSLRSHYNKSINICIPFTGYGGDYPGLQIFPESKNFLKKMFIKKTQRFHFINYFLNSINPVVKKGSYICFNQNVYHRRTILNCTKTRMNLEFRIFPENIDDKNLELEFI